MLLLRGIDNNLAWNFVFAHASTNIYMSEGSRNLEGHKFNYRYYLLKKLHCI